MTVPYIVAAEPNQPYGGNNTYCVSLLHMDGSNDSTTFTDVALGAGSSPLTWTAEGGAEVSTSSSKFGTGSLSVASSSSSYITTPSNALFDAIGTKPFSVDMWVNLASVSTLQYLTGVINSSGTSSSVSFFVSVTSSGVLTFSVFSSSTEYSATAGTLTAETWQHVACVANGTDIYAALNGTFGSGVAYSSINTTSQNLSIGRAGAYSSGYTNGYIDEYRLVIGANPFGTSNFTPPTGPYSS